MPELDILFIQITVHDVFLTGLGGYQVCQNAATIILIDPSIFRDTKRGLDVFETRRQRTGDYGLRFSSSVENGSSDPPAIPKGHERRSSKKSSATTNEA